MPTAAAYAAVVHRFEVFPGPGRANARGLRVKAEAESLGIRLDAVEARRVYLIEAAIGPAQVKAVGERLLADAVVEQWRTGAGPAEPGGASVEVHPLPGVMDPAAQSVREAAADLLDLPLQEVRVSTGWRYDLRGPGAGRAAELATRLLANPVVHAIHTEPYHPDRLPLGHAAEFRLRHIPLRRLDDAGLTKLSREAHLFLSPEEMRAIRDEYRRLDREPTDIELETLAQTWSEHCVHKTLKSRIRYRSETARQRDGEAGGRQHGADLIDWEGRPGHTVHEDGSVTIDNLLKSTVAAATHELIAEGVDWTLSVFKDNAGVIALDDDTAVCIKVETHNHPSALEPYGGSATGIGGCIRDVIGTGLGAKPIANTDVFCVAFPEHWTQSETARRRDGETGEDAPAVGADAPASLSRPSAASLPAGCLHPKRILTDVVAGVRDYGNRMGIPTLNGAVYFDDRYVGNPLVFCGCIGVMPRDRIHGAARPGDLIVALGGRTGRDGIHGATFSSAELTDTHTDEFSHAVQIGNAIEEKRLLDAILRARDYVAGSDEAAKARSDEGDSRTADSDPQSLRRSVARPLFHAITDCGAGGFSSAVGEMGGAIGAAVQLENAPLKYDGLTYTEIWISEAQERMVLAVPRENLASLRRICDEEHVELAVLGTFGTPGAELVLTYRGTEVGRLPMHFLHEGLPQPTREAVWASRETARQRDSEAGRDTAAQIPSPVSLSRSLADSLFALLAHPNIASKHWIIRQYDHEVQGNTILRPLVGPAGRGPGDASVVEPVPGSGRGVAVACGLATGFGDPVIGGDPYLAAIAGIDECVRNLVCVGADPDRIAILDNFCWPSCNKPENLGSLVRAAEGCYDGAKAYRTPFVSGKDSLNNQFTIPGEGGAPGRTIEIPPTLLITGMGVVPDLARCVTMDAKRAGNVLLLVGGTTGAMGGSHHAQLFGAPRAAFAADAGPLAAEIERRAGAVLAGLPEGAKAHARSLLRSLAPVAVGKLDQLVASFGPRASEAAKRLAARLGNPAIERLAAEIGPDRVQDLLRIVADAAQAQGLSPAVPRFDPHTGARTARAVAACIRDGLAAAAHDCSDGGLAVAVAEMLIGGGSPRAPLGAQLVAPPDSIHPTAWMFAETPGRYLLEVPALRAGEAERLVAERARGVSVREIGVLDGSGRLRCEALGLDVGVESLTAAWRGTLDW
ncbi:MAG TPA: phosphoribosylformylglycinamidine synthase subunit PurS [Phycisphaerales bacterium]|nr:phosphoribosylformylglycinamidine synthase subunit PurS [Phycisphaerales bacterium]